MFLPSLCSVIKDFYPARREVGAKRFFLLEGPVVVDMRPRSSEYYKHPNDHSYVVESKPKELEFRWIDLPSMPRLRFLDDSLSILFTDSHCQVPSLRCYCVA